MFFFIIYLFRQLFFLFPLQQQQQQWPNIIRTRSIFTTKFCDTTRAIFQCPSSSKLLLVLPSIDYHKNISLGCDLQFVQLVLLCIGDKMKINLQYSHIRNIICPEMILIFMCVYKVRSAPAPAVCRRRIIQDPLHKRLIPRYMTPTILSPHQFPDFLQQGLRNRKKTFTYHKMMKGFKGCRIKSKYIYCSLRCVSIKLGLKRD